MGSNLHRPTVVDQMFQPSARPSYNFGFTDFLNREYRFRLDADRPLCKAFLQGHCPLGDQCPDKHQYRSNYNNLVCKHWLRGLCKKGDTCEFLHEYNLRMMPECTQYARRLTCLNGTECLYLHIDPATKLPPCLHYDRGFCPLGPNCAARHVRRKTICQYYLAGFCPDGKACEVGAHPVWREKEDMIKPKIRVELSLEEKETEKRRLLAKLEDEREQEARDFQERPMQDRRQQGRGRGKKNNWNNRQRKDRF